MGANFAKDVAISVNNFRLFLLQFYEKLYSYVALRSRSTVLCWKATKKIMGSALNSGIGLPQTIRRHALNMCRFRSRYGGFEGMSQTYNTKITLDYLVSFKETSSFLACSSASLPFLTALSCFFLPSSRASMFCTTSAISKIRGLS